MPSQRASKIKDAVENKLVTLLKKRGEAVTKEELQTLSIAVKFLAVSVKMDMDEWGSGIDDLDKDEGGENDTETDI